jgi:signal transduction histidine kinase
MKIQPQKPIYLRREAGPALYKASGNTPSGKIPVFTPFNLSYFFKSLSGLLRPVSSFFYKVRIALSSFVLSFVYHSYQFIQSNKLTGLTAGMDDYEKRKLGIFNELNLFQLLTGIIVPVSVILNEKRLPAVAAFVIISPPLISLLVLSLNARKKHVAAMISYFALYPFFTSLAYINGINLGVDLFFVLYGILSVFFLQHISHMIFCIGFNMVNYFMLAVVLKNYQYHLEISHPFFYLLNHLMAIVFIFYGLYLIKKENAGYQAGILQKNDELQLINEEVKKQKEVIAEKARQLEQHTSRLNEIDGFKNKLFSIVSHDLKTPLYALRNLFTEIQQQRMPAAEINKLIPHVVKDLNYATGLTENLLHWAKSQMHAGSVYPQVLHIAAIIDEIIQQQRLQAELKEINIEAQLKSNLFIYADRDMVALVVRNLLSNAVKFTPRQGTVSVGINEMSTHAEIFISDTGAGMEAEALNKIRNNDYFTTRGTANEPGTGLGLILCKEFLEKNNGQLHIESVPGQGSTFSFTLPRAKQ